VPRWRGSAAVLIAALDRLRAKLPPGVLPWTVLAAAETRKK
jgi:hypothetical protein